jgi:hypothetical protein
MNVVPAQDSGPEVQTLALDFIEHTVETTEHHSAVTTINCANRKQNR